MSGRALLRSDFDTTGWGPRVVREHVTKAVLAIEQEAASAAVAEVLDDHVPSGGDDMSGYGYVECSCGFLFDESQKVGWADHIRAALIASERGT